MELRHLIRKKLNQNLEINSKIKSSHAEKPLQFSPNLKSTQILEGHSDFGTTFPGNCSPASVALPGALLIVINKQSAW